MPVMYYADVYSIIATNVLSIYILEVQEASMWSQQIMRERSDLSERLVSE